MNKQAIIGLSLFLIVIVLAGANFLFSSQESEHAKIEEKFTIPEEEVGDLNAENKNNFNEEDYEVDKLKDISFCEKLKNDFEKNECFISVAKQNGNLSACDQIKDYSERDNCYLDILEMHYAGKFELYGGSHIYYLESVCKNMETKDTRDDCYLMMALNEESSSFCGVINNQIKRNNCYAELEGDWEPAIKNNLGIELTLSEEFIEAFGTPYYLGIDQGRKGEIIQFPFKDRETYSRKGISLKAYTSDYEGDHTFPLYVFGDWKGEGSLKERCLEYDAPYERDCRILEIGGKEVVLETVLSTYEGACDAIVLIYLNNDGDSPYKGLNFSLELPDFSESVCNSFLEKSYESLVSDFHIQSEKIMEGQGLSEGDSKKLTLFKDMIGSIKFLK